MSGEGFSTRAIHCGDELNRTGAVVTPIFQTTSFAMQSAEHGADLFAGAAEGYSYTRLGNPTLAELEAKLADLEGGEEAVATASGMAAVTTAVLSIVNAGDHVIADSAIYGGSYSFFSEQARRLGLDVTFVDTSNLEAVRAAFRPATRLLYSESPGNPHLKLVDLGALAVLARERDVPLLCDNTFATPYLQRPLALGATAVVHSATKYLGGHGDVIAGAIVGSRAIVGPARRSILRDYGGVLAPLNAWLVTRGLATLALRMERHCASAIRIAVWLESHPAVAWVRYPGLPSHPQHELARRQMRSAGGMIAFEVRGGIGGGRRLMNAVRLCTRAVSLGDVRTLICHPASTTHAQVPQEVRLAAGITDGLVRFSVGLEDADDIIADLEQALAEFPQGAC